MSRSTPKLRLRAHSASEYEALQEQRIKTEEVIDGTIYEAMARITPTKATVKTEAVSMPVRIENIVFERSRHTLARISMQMILLDPDYQPSISRLSTMTDGVWSFNKPLELVGAKPMKVGFLIPSIPEDPSKDPFATEWIDERESIYT